MPNSTVVILEVAGAGRRGEMNLRWKRVNLFAAVWSVAGGREMVAVEQRLLSLRFRWVRFQRQEEEEEENDYVLPEEKMPT